MPIQILLTGIVLTLVAVLFIPPSLYRAISLVSCTIKLRASARRHIDTTRVFDRYSACRVNVPPGDDPGHTELSNGWNIGQRAAWMLMMGTTSGLIQMTHIHFLTLLYPSKMERRLIYWLLGLTLSPLSQVLCNFRLLAQNDSVTLYAGAIKNVCNAALSLLFTSALLSWGLLVNRKQAWRTDGGTAVYGAGAVTLAILSTVLNFFYIPRQDEYIWLPSLIWAVVLWQSFLGWWWWVGAGMVRQKERKSRTRSPKAISPTSKRSASSRVGTVFLWPSFIRDRFASKAPPRRSPTPVRDPLR
ncbi:hypothetical protein DL96DRAFT_1707519 [Flagelloscypha sp. PMI_526]|nr:hypothetical protein DL96DRAFT_1707519 [Flagelloscypha sp. PMI_526]